MQDTRILAASNNRPISKTAASLDEFMGEFRFDFGLVNTGFNKAADAKEPRLGDRAGFAHEVDFEVRFDNPQPVHQSSKPLIIVQWVAGLGVFEESSVARFDFNDGALVLVCIE